MAPIDPSVGIGFADDFVTGLMVSDSSCTVSTLNVADLHMNAFTCGRHRDMLSHCIREL
jgi:hypothetical protein